MSAAPRILPRVWCRRGPSVVAAEAPFDGVVFDPASGETHFLNELPALLLSVIDARPATLQQLVERLAGAVELGDEDLSKVFAALAFLEESELVESQSAQAA